MSTDETQLAIYGERSDVKELSQRLLKMLPDVREVGEAGALALAQVALSMGLNPFVGEVWPIPQKHNGKVVGWSIFAGIKGLRRAARLQAERLGGVYPFFKPSFRLPSDDEKELAGLGQGDRMIVCELEIMLPADHHWYAANDHQRYIVEGVGVVRRGEQSRMEILQLLRKRAEADVLKQAFDLPLEAAEAPGPDSPSVATGEWDFIEPELEPSVEVEPELARTWPGGTIKAIVEADLARNSYHACHALNLSEVLSPDDELDVVLGWVRDYRAARDGGTASVEAAQEADARLRSAIGDSI
jgi:hypothetical protein